MKIVIAGGTGFVGKALTKRLIDKGHKVIILTRKGSQTGGNPTFHQWLTGGSSSSIQDIDVMINLAGESLSSGRWTTARKERILSSRIEATEAVLALMKNNPPKTFINASAIGYYGTSLTETFTEEYKAAGTDFLATTVKNWEELALQSTTRTILCRFGIILDKTEGALPRMALPYKFFAGGTVGDGKQWMSWIHIQDVVEAILFLMEHEEIVGPVNFTAPNPISMKELGQAIGKALERPHWIPAPSLALKMALGEMSLLVLEGQRVLPEKLQQAGYRFLYEKIDEALANIYQA
ncbi:TIGR01777 family protein [Robertmurraya yapensis]|uniref:TIGR01777 family protein n=1 Tax=Bacillus yapensis TaxID=2492960 RepID=A0A431VSQ1_9BACI|nr:TIGR01777 family oxidoreductase [Bacillus yapensis]RTR26169.1 TIGR01777 family protein [Bacillus yapensis]TKS93607.1 TIGR01777 family protein [Bacillus yapensis]